MAFYCCATLKDTSTNKKLVFSSWTPGGYSKYTCRGEGGGSDVFFWVENLHARYFFWVKRSVTYFFRSKISGLCIFLGLQYEAASDPPPVMYTSSTPLDLEHPKKDQNT